MDLLLGGWQFNTNTFIQSGLPFNVDVSRTPARIATPGRTAPT